MSAAMQDALAAVPEALLAGLARTELLAARAACSACRIASRRPLTVVLVEAAAAAAAAAGHGASRSLRVASALRGLAAVSAGQCSPQAALTLTRLMEDGDFDVREAAASALGSSVNGLSASGIKAELSRTAVACLAPALADQSARVSAAAARALPRLVARGDEAATRVACAHLRRHSDPCVRRNALCVLAEVGQRGNSDLVAAVCAAAQGDGDWRVRAQAARALPRLAERGDAAALAALEGGMRDPSSVVRGVAGAAIVHIAERPSAPFIAVLAEQWSPARRKRAAPGASPAPTPPSLASRPRLAPGAGSVETPPAPAARPRRVQAAQAAPAASGRAGSASGPSGAGRGQGRSGAAGKTQATRRAPQARRARNVGGQHR